jgi:exonuclease VII small subunit
MIHKARRTRTMSKQEQINRLSAIVDEMMQLPNAISELRKAAALSTEAQTILCQLEQDEKKHK